MERQTAKEPVKNVGSNFMKAKSGLFEFLLIKFILFGSITLEIKFTFTIILPILYLYDKWKNNQ